MLHIRDEGITLTPSQDYAAPEMTHYLQSDERWRADKIGRSSSTLGAKDGEFLVADPLRAEKDPIPLSVHGRVYAYRVLFSDKNAS